MKAISTRSNVGSQIQQNQSHGSKFTKVKGGRKQPVR
jgi:hypothetical protein